MTERTLVLIKPDAVGRGLIGEVIGRLERKGLTIDTMVLREMDAAALAQGLKPGTPLVANLDGFPWRAQLPALAGPIVAQIDGRKTIAEIYTAMALRGGLPVWDEFQQQFEQIYMILNGINHLLLRFRA